MGLIRRGSPAHRARRAVRLERERWLWPYRRVGRGLLGVLDRHRDEIPVAQPPDEGRLWTNEAFAFDDGWRIGVFYDCGEYDYIEFLAPPDGDPIDFWAWPECSQREMLCDWHPWG